MALIHYWKLDEENATDVAVDSVGDCDLSPGGEADPPVVADTRFGFVREWPPDDGNERVLRAPGISGSSGGDGTTEQFVSAAHPLNINFVGQEWSLTWWMRVNAGFNAEAGLFYVGRLTTQTCTHFAPATVHPSGHNHSLGVGHLGVRYSTSEIGSWYWNYASGAQRSGNDGSNPVPTYGIWLHHAIVRRGANVEHWRQGKLLISSAWVSEPYTPQDNFDDPGFLPGPDVFEIGRAGNGITTGNVYWAKSLALAHVRLYDHALTEAEIVAQSSPSLDDTAPVISNVSPAAGTPMGRHDAWAFRVTDDVGFRRTMVWATLKDATGRERGKEVIWDGSAFSSAWSPGTRTEVTAGKVYDFAGIRRNGGIPQHITDVVFDVAAIDTAGNEGT